MRQEQSPCPPQNDSPFLALPAEVLFLILTELDPIDVSALAQTSRRLHGYTTVENHVLWRTLFTNLFDEPNKPGHEIADYSECVKERCRARGVVRSPHADKQTKHREAVLVTLYQIFTSTPSMLPLGSSKNATCLEALLSSRSAVQDWLTCCPPWKKDSGGSDEEPRNLPPTPSENMLAHLHVAGMSMREIAGISYKKGQPYREEVYRGTNFDSDNLYGPLIRNEDESLSVDWRMVDAISIVMSLNVRSAWHQWGEESEQEILPYGFHQAVFHKTPGPGKDWAGVTGKWNYIYAFIDYNDYFAYNFAPDAVQGRRNDLNNISEAVGGINTLELALAPDEEQDPNEENLPYPTLRFKGQSTGPTGSLFRGSVQRLSNGYVHWEFVIRYSGSDRWQTSGVELGGRGVYGIWSDVLHEDLSPCGPVWYFRS